MEISGLFLGGIIFFLVIIVVVYSLKVFKIKASAENERNRIKTLDKQADKIKEGEVNQDVKDILDKVTQPVSQVIETVYQPKNGYKLERMLKVAGWNNYFTPATWTAFTVILGAIGLFLGWMFYGSSKIFAAIFAFIPIIVPTFLLKNSYTNMRETLLTHFPETIRIITGYLSGGLILTEAMKEASKSTSAEWKKLLEGFLAHSEAESPKKALDWLAQEADIPEGKEFFATVRLTMELGGSVKDGFLRQAESIDELIEIAQQKKIEKRKVWATIVQAPIFLDIIAAVALPVIGNMGDLFS